MRRERGWRGENLFCLQSACVLDLFLRRPNGVCVHPTVQPEAPAASLGAVRPLAGSRLGIRFRCSSIMNAVQVAKVSELHTVEKSPGIVS